ncbi:beta strand repeat-containing protein [Meiothermus granaticius]|uniref:DUF11 domain-containing protein n=1 Tax=Meiothermus granaticius NBRC 107808 TaxID=1227551 RepID=A0A399FDN8_9DEIN|nr:DUF11 domain-containing protein [Meiothermus granaticius]RIH93905.1 hypothetical protein Mgrana_00254 [Meiothermus granaticius NBRC 107808]GEM86402.1 hypothetical protein MGR01S_10270 [Meiothermus granaticius NBRC 107808]
MRRLSILFTALWVLLLGFALAQQTAAGTNISNQASASYIDSAGQARTTTSNQVITVVQQVYSFTITPDGIPTAPGQTRSALPGAQVYFTYTVTNTGNGTDTINLATVQDTSDNFDFSGVTLYLDANCNGRVDAGESTVSAVTLTQTGASASACIVVAATIPASATSGQYGNLNLTGTSAGDNTKTDTNNWARGTATTAAALDLTKAASPSNAVAPGATLTYTLSGQNRGGSAASAITNVGGTGLSGILIQDVIPNGLTVTTSGSNPSGTAGAGSVQFVYYNGTTWSTTLPATITGNGTVALGMVITGSGAFFPQNASYTFSFQATVPAGAAQGTTYSNTATLLYNNGSNQTVTSNTTTNTVGASYGIAVGPNGNPTATAGADSQTIASAISGQTVIFTNTLRNTGNTSDSFTLAVSGAPSGWVCQLTQTDGTPISGPIGPVASATNYNFQVRCAVPAAYTGGPVNLTVSGTSVSDTSKTDPTTDTITTVTSGYAVDLAARGNGGDGNPANDNPPAQSVNPGSSANFSIEVVNTGSNADTYNLTSSVPAGWSTVFYPDATCSGVLASPTPAPLTSTGLMNPGAANKKCFIAQVQVPAGAAPVTSTTNVTFTSTSTTLGSVSDSVTTGVSVNLLQGFAFTPNRSGTVTTPGTIVYTHNLSNTGNAGVTVSIPAFTSAYGWTYQFSTDGGTTWTSSVSGLAIAAGGSSPLQVRVIVPGGEPIGRQEAATFTATATYSGGSTATSGVTDTTTVVGGDLRLTKSAVSYQGNAETTVRSASAAVANPGDRIVYTVVAQNIGTGNLTNVRISDPLPAYTSFVSVSASATGFASGTVLYSTDNGTTWSATAPGTLSAGQSIMVGVDTNGDNKIDASDIMAPASQITLIFKVVVQ